MVEKVHTRQSFEALRAFGFFGMGGMVWAMMEGMGKEVMDHENAV